ncbi:MAG: sulfite exporter TauE/SafE family protein [Rickettsiales bacterium]|nr:sulfite exporter TauE/SafE family protein [Rickettsiales bacterium]
MDILLIFSLFSLGFFGGFSHCIGMCGPFVITQVGSKLSKIDINKYNNFSRLKNLALLPYHLGRITTYSLLGGLSSLFTTTIQNQSSFKIISFIFLLLAILFFIKIFFSGFGNYQSINLGKLGLFFKSNSVKNVLFFLEKKISFLFNNPTNVKGYFLGIILGFIPCGLLYGALLISANMGSFIAGMVGMTVFGIATFPALFVTALGFDFFKKSTFFKVITKIFVLINIATLSLMAVSQISF